MADCILLPNCLHTDVEVIAIAWERNIMVTLLPSMKHGLAKYNCG